MFSSRGRQTLQRLNFHTAFEEEGHLVLHTSVRELIVLLTPAPGDPMASSGPCRQVCSSAHTAPIKNRNNLFKQVFWSKLGMGKYTFEPSTWESQADRSLRVQKLPGLHSKFQESLSNIVSKTLSQNWNKIKVFWFELSYVPAYTNISLLLFILMISLYEF